MTTTPAHKRPAGPSADPSLARIRFLLASKLNVPRPQSTDTATAPLGALSLGRVLDQPQAASLGQRPEGVHVRRAAGDVDGDDRRGPVADGGLRGSRVKVLGLRIDIRETGTALTSTHAEAVAMNV